MDCNYNSMLDLISRRRHDIKRSQQAIKWAALNLVVASVIVLDIYNELLFFHSSFKFFHSFLRYIEIFLSLLFIVNATYDLLLYAWLYFWMKPIEMKDSDRKLFGISDNEIGFISFKPISEPEIRKEITKLSSSFRLTPENTSFPSPSNSLSNMNQYYTSTPNSSMVANASSRNFTINSFMHSESNPPSSSFIQSPSSKESPLLRKRLSGRRSINDSIESEESLRDYLKNYDQVENRIQQMEEADRHQKQQSSLISGELCLDNVNYQPANDASIASFVDPHLLSSHLKSVDDICHRFKIKEEKLVQWVENIRKWISQTIILQLNKDIQEINRTLSQTGLNSSLIGEMGLSAFKQLASLKAKEIPKISSVLRYLELTSQQEYLVKRYHDLGKGGCIGDFVWNRGGNFKTKQWTEEWPTDSRIIMHAFCTYMDSRLPTNPTHPNGKSFSLQHFKMSKEQKSDKNAFYILQEKLNPPHYNLIVNGDEMVEIPGGRNNTFFTLAAFFHHVKMDHFGLLGRINLGYSGINVLWTIQNE